MKFFRIWKKVLSGEQNGYHGTGVLWINGRGPAAAERKWEGKTAAAHEGENPPADVPRNETRKWAGQTPKREGRANLSAGAKPPPAPARFCSPWVYRFVSGCKKWGEFLPPVRFRWYILAPTLAPLNHADARVAPLRCPILPRVKQL